MNKLSPGGAWRIKGPYEHGSPEIEEVPAEIADRALFIRFQYLGGAERGEGFEDECCAMFQDPLTDEVYGQPCEEKLGYTSSRIFSGAQDRQVRPGQLHLLEVGRPHASTTGADPVAGEGYYQGDPGLESWEV